MHDRNGKFGKKKRNATRSGCTQTESLLRVAIGAECTFPQLKTQHGTWRDCLALLGHVMYFYFTGGLFFLSMQLEAKPAKNEQYETACHTHYL